MTRDAFDGNNFATGHEWERHETTVDGAVTTFAAHIPIDNRDRARAAISFRASLLRTGQTVAPQPFEERQVGRNRIDADGLAVESKLERAHNRRVSGFDPRLIELSC
jgi:hypothetical protein